MNAHKCRLPIRLQFRLDHLEGSKGITRALRPMQVGGDIAVRCCFYSGGRDCRLMRNRRICPRARNRYCPPPLPVAQHATWTGGGGQAGGGLAWKRARGFQEDVAGRSDCGTVVEPDGAARAMRRVRPLADCPWALHEVHGSRTATVIDLNLGAYTPAASGDVPSSEIAFVESTRSTGGLASLVRP